MYFYQYTKSSWKQEKWKIIDRWIITHDYCICGFANSKCRLWYHKWYLKSLFFSCKFIQLLMAINIFMPRCIFQRYYVFSRQIFWVLLIFTDQFGFLENPWIVGLLHTSKLKGSDMPSLCRRVFRPQSLRITFGRHNSFSRIGTGFTTTSYIIYHVFSILMSYLRLFLLWKVCACPC